MQHIIQATSFILENTSEQVKEDIIHLNRKVREEAIGLILQWLHQGDTYSDLITQSTPLWLIKEEWDYLGALWYIETMLHQWRYFAFSWLQEVIEESNNKLISLQNQEQYEHADTIQEALLSIFQLMESLEQYSCQARFHMLRWQFLEIIDNSQWAMESYAAAKELKDPDGYLRTAHIYEEQGDFMKSSHILDTGWHATKDVRILSKLVSTLCRAEKISEALARYEELKQLRKDEISPFIVYLWKIEDDQSLELLEDILAKYQTDVLTDESFTPSEALTWLSKSAFEYIGKEFVKEDEIIRNINTKSEEPWASLTDEENAEYIRAFEHRLWLMQADLMSLKNNRFLSTYLSDIKNIVSQGPVAMDVIYKFFEHHSSPEASFQIDWEDNEGENGEIIPVKIIREWFDGGSVYQTILNHIAKIGETFYQGTEYQTIRNEINPLIISLVDADFDIEDAVKDEVQSSFAPLKSELDFLDSLQSSIRENYYDLLDAFTEKYGMFYRRTIQCLARNPHITPEKYPKVLEQYEDIALVFFVEKMIAWQFPYGDFENIDSLVKKYHLNEVRLDDATLFAFLLFNVSPEYSLEFVIANPYLLNVPSVVYLALECVRQIDEEFRDSAMRDLDAIVDEEFWVASFDKFVSGMHDDFTQHEDEVRSWDMSYMFLSRWNMEIISWREKDESSDEVLLNFLTASELEWIEWLLQAGDSSESAGDYKRALEYFNTALAKDDTISVLAKCISCAIKLKDLNMAEKYLLHGASKEYGLHGHKLALLLRKKQVKESLDYIIFMIRDGVEIYDTVDGTMQLLQDTIVSTLRLPNTHDIDIDAMKMAASFIHSRLRTDSSDVSVEGFMNHWTYVEAFSSRYDTKVSYEYFLGFLSQIIGEVNDIPVLNDAGFATGRKSYDSATDEEKLEFFLHNHAFKILNRIKKEMEQTDSSVRLNELLGYSISFAGKALTVLRKFCPNSNYIHIWQSVMITPTEGEIAKERPADYLESKNKTYH